MMMMNALLLLCGISLSFSLQRAAAAPVYCMQRDLDIWTSSSGLPRIAALQRAVSRVFYGFLSAAPTVFCVLLHTHENFKSRPIKKVSIDQLTPASYSLPATARVDIYMLQDTVQLSHFAAITKEEE